MISIIDDQHDKSDVKRCRTAERKIHAIGEIYLLDMQVNWASR